MTNLKGALIPRIELRVANRILKDVKTLAQISSSLNLSSPWRQVFDLADIRADAFIVLLRILEVERRGNLQGELSKEIVHGE